MLAPRNPPAPGHENRPTANGFLTNHWCSSDILRRTVWECLLLADRGVAAKPQATKGRHYASLPYGMAHDAVPHREP
jgi:hypothetical protein